MSRTAALALTAALSAAGCGDPPPAGPSSARPNPAANIPNAATPAKGGAAEPAAADFLKAVSAGTVTAERFTPAFLKVVGPPDLPADVAKGYDATAALAWVRGRGDKLTFGPAAAKQEAGDAAVFTGAVTGGAKPARYLLRMARTGGEWKADWFQTGPTPPAAGFAGDPAAGFAAQAFVDAVLAKDTKLVAGLLSADGKKALAPPAFKSDEAAGYSAGELADKVAKFGAGVDGYALAAAGTGAFRADLSGVKRTLTVKVAPGATAGVWLVADAKAE